MIEQTLVSINGIIMNPLSAQISVFDRGFLFGDSIYEATLFKKGVPLFWQEHIHRLEQSATLLQMSINIDLKKIEQWIEELALNFQHPQGLLRLVITRGEGVVNLAPLKHYRNNLVLFLAPLNYPQEWYQKGLKYFISTIERNSIKALNPKAKTGNYLNSQLALMEGKNHGYDDSLLINAKGFITEGTTNNFWFIQNKTIFTAANNQGILEGITRDKIFQLVHDLGFKLQLGSWTIEQALKAEEAFMTSATKGVVPIVQLSQWKIGQGTPGPITQQLHQAYEKMVDHYFTNGQWKSL